MLSIYMLSRGIRISFVVGILMVLIALGLHLVLKLYNAPEDVEFGLLNTFVATFASIVLSFFAGALLADYQIERDSARRMERLERLLDAELSQAIEDLENAVPVEFRMPDGSTERVGVAPVEPLMLEEAVRNGLFDDERSAEAIRLLGRMRFYNSRVAQLGFSTIAGAEHAASFRRLAGETENLRREILAGLRDLLDRNA